MKNPQLRNFYFGAATSAHQVEGGNNNDWTEWEKKTAPRLASLARNKEWPKHIIENYPTPLQEENYISGRAADHYHYFEKDFDAAQQLGHNAHRFSVEWSRIEPEEGKFDEKPLAHYKHVIAALRSRGIEPFVTLWHWTLPSWLARQGGVLNKGFAALFIRYVERVMRALGNEVSFWITLNEPEIYALNSYCRGIWPPEKKGIINFYRSRARLIATHRRAYALIKQRDPRAQVGVSCNLSYFEPGGGPINSLLVLLAKKLWNHHFLNHTKEALDFIGLNYYFHNRVEYGFNKNRNERVSDMGWELHPDGIAHVLRDLARYRKPIYVTENGLADARDLHRGWYFQQIFKAIRACIRNGVDVRGYFHWSLLDNFEWDKGFWPRFGLLAVDYRTMQRTVRESALLFKEYIQKQQ